MNASDPSTPVDLEALACERRRRIEKLDAVARLAAGLSTELSPLIREAGTTVQALLHTRSADVELQEQLEGVRESLQRSAVLLRNVESVGRAVVRPSMPVDLNAVVAKFRLLIPRLAGPFVRYTEALASKGAWAVVEMGQLEQILLTLVGNARDAMPLGGALTVATHRWSLAEPRLHAHGELAAGEWVVLEVRDSGAGMDERTQSHLFEPFFTTKLPGQGSGLGLAAVYGMVRQRGGQVVVESAPGGGTTVRVCFPMRAPATVGRHAADGGAILVVDDDDWVRHVTARVLRHAGYGVLEAEHGESALELLRDVAGRCVGTVLTDIHMPRLDGHRLAAVVRRTHPSLRVVLMTGAQVEGEPADSILRKPFTASELLSAVQGAPTH